MFVMILLLIMMIVIMIGSGIAVGRVHCVKDGDRGNQNCGRDK
jgi:hypothetical protein